jgi:putative membrane protein
MLGYIVRFLGNSIALYGATYFLAPSFSISGGYKEYLLAGALLGLLNMTVRPILRLVLTPVVMLSLGLFIIVINALMLWIVDYTFSFVYIGDLTVLVWATVIVSIVNMITASFSKLID